MLYLLPFCDAYAYVSAHAFIYLGTIFARPHQDAAAPRYRSTQHRHTTDILPLHSVGFRHA